MTLNFWIEQSVTSAMYFSAYLATALLRYNVLELKEPEYNALNNSIQKHRGKLIGNNFRTYINDIDFSNKKDTWKNKYQAKLENLTRKV
jgi:DNA-binding ferritin-like protein (Dps family)